MTMQLQPFTIGDLTIDLPVILPSLTGYTDQAYRMICRELGAGYCGTEMLLDKSLLVNEKLRRRNVQMGEGDHPLSAQLIGNTPAEMAAAAEHLCRMGVDAVDLNFACPVRKALARRRGGYLMDEPDTALAITRAVIAAADRPVTLKLRKSFRQEQTDHAALWRILDGAFEAGAAAACVHGRSVEAKYTGQADWAVLAETKRRYAGRTIIGSGDVLTPAAAIEMLKQTGVDAVAAARGVLGNPWFFRQVRDLAAGREPFQPSVAEQRELMGRHFDRAVEIYGLKKGPRIMRKFGIKYASLHPTPKAIRMAFVAVKTPQDWQEVLRTFYAD